MPRAGRRHSVLPLPFSPLLSTHLLKVGNVLPHNDIAVLVQIRGILIKASKPLKELGHVGIMKITAFQQGTGKGLVGCLLSLLPVMELFLHSQKSAGSKFVHGWLL